MPHAPLVLSCLGLIFSLLAAVVGRAGEPYENQWGPFTGTVVNAQTGKPIPGAVFVVMWDQRIPYIGHSYTKFFDANVAVANEAGQFEIPRRNPPDWSLGRVDPPLLVCVAPGHAPLQDVGAQNAPLLVKLKPLNREEIRNWGSHSGWTGSIPMDVCRPLGQRIDEKRAALHLPAIEFCAGIIESPRR